MPGQAKLSVSLEDYLESIYMIHGEKQGVRAKDIAARLGVGNSSVTGALHALCERGLINYAPYDIITLTPRGRTAAGKLARRHGVLRSFFSRILGVPEPDADGMACRVEHALTEPVIDRLEKFVGLVEKCPRGGADWVAEAGETCGFGANQEICGECVERCAERARETAHRARHGKPRKPAGGPPPLVVKTRPITELATGDRARLASIQAPRAERHRLSAMGLTPGTDIEIIHTARGGAVLVGVKDTRVMLGRALAAKILVEC